MAISNNTTQHLAKSVPKKVNINGRLIQVKSWLPESFPASKDLEIPQPPFIFPKTIVVR